MNCPECRSSDIERIGLYDYKCNSCGDVFDATEHLDTMIMITLKIGETMTKREYSMFNSKTS